MKKKSARGEGGGKYRVTLYTAHTRAILTDELNTYNEYV